MRSGLLVEGHATRPALMEGHTPPYYIDLVEAAGFYKLWDTVAWLSVFPPQARRVEDVIPPKLLRTAQWAANRSHARLRPVDLSHWEAEVAVACQIYNAALAHLPNWRADSRKRNSRTCSRFFQAAGRSRAGIFRRGER